MEIAERLQELRKKAGYSQEQVAEMLGLSRQAISKWESGQGKPEIDNVIKMTEIYNVSSDYILLGTEHKTITPMLAVLYSMRAARWFIPESRAVPEALVVPSWYRSLQLT